jgi:PAS domain S-box-containing protein
LNNSDQRRSRTENKHLEEQLKTLSCAVEQNPGTIVVTDISGNIEYVNPKFTQLTGYTSQEAIGQNPRILKTDKTPPEVYERLWKTISSGKEWRGEFCNKKKNGDLYWESASISPVKNSKGSITHFVAVKEDITERKQMEEKLKLFNEYLEQSVTERTKELREKNVELIKEITERKLAERKLQKSKEMLSRAQQISSMGSWEWDKVKEEIIWSEETCHLFGLKSDGFDGKYETFLTFVHPEDRDLVKKSVKASLLKERPYNIDFRIVLRDGVEHIIHSEAQVEFDKIGTPIRMTGISQDITERKHAEEQIKASLKEKEVLLNEVHHRVKNNLQVISSLLDMSSMQTQNQDTIELFAELRNRVESMALIHSQLYESERFDEINMERHIQELSANLLNIYSKEKTMTLDIKSANVFLPVTQAVPCALVLNELISNALKHAYRDGQKGTISIIMQQSDNGTTLLKVKDDGSGIPEDIDIGMAKSLGLKLARNIVYKQLNGRIEIVRNKGTEFTVEFEHSKEDS